MVISTIRKERDFESYLGPSVWGISLVIASFFISSCELSGTANNTATTSALTSSDASLLYVSKQGDTMSGTLNLPANGLVAGTNQLVLNGGNVGIGTATPLAALAVVTNAGAGQGGNNPQLVLNNASAANGIGIVEALGASSSGAVNGHIVMSSSVFNSGWNMVSNNGGVSAAISTNANAQFRVVSTVDGNTYSNPALFTVESGGNVGIGTTTPGANLDVMSTSSDPAVRVTTYNLAAAGVADFVAYAARGTPASPSSVLANDRLVDFRAHGYNGSAWTAGANVAIEFDATENWSTTANGTRMTFATTPNGSSSRIERMRIDQNGKVGIGTTGPNFLLDVGSASVVGSVANFTNSTGSCNINPTATALSCSSDERLKKDFELIHGALESLSKLEGVSFHWKKESKSDPKHIGFIAQEVEKVFPEFVSTDKDGFKQVNYMGFVSVLTNGIKELHAKVLASDQELEQLKKENAELKTENVAIKIYLCHRDPNANICK